MVDWRLKAGRLSELFCVVLYTEAVYNTVVRTLRRAVITVLWMGFCLTGPISLCVDSFVFMYFMFISFILHICHIIVTW